MYFVIFATDKPGAEQTRAEARPRHREYLRNPGDHAVKVRLGGPTLTEDGERMNGTLLVVEAERIEDVRAFLAGDPYSRASLFESVTVRPWNWGIGKPEELQ